MVPNRLSTRQHSAPQHMGVCVWGGCHHTQSVFEFEGLCAFNHVLAQGCASSCVSITSPCAFLYFLPVCVSLPSLRSRVCGPVLNGPSHFPPARRVGGKWPLIRLGLLPQSILMLIYQTCSLARRTTLPMFLGPWGAISSVRASGANCKGGNSTTHIWPHLI